MPSPGGILLAGLCAVPVVPAAMGAEQELPLPLARPRAPAGARPQPPPPQPQPAIPDWSLAADLAVRTGSLAWSSRVPDGQDGETDAYRYRASNVRVVELGTRLDGAAGPWRCRAGLSAGRVVDGDALERAYDPATGAETWKLASRVEGGWTLAGELAVGMGRTAQAGRYRVAALAGWAWRRERLEQGDALQQVPNQAEFPAFSSRTTATWSGPFLDGTAGCWILHDLRLEGGLRLQYLSYSGSQEIDADPADPQALTGTSQAGNGFGLSAGAALAWRCTPSTELFLRCAWESRRVHGGSDAAVYADGSRQDYELGDVETETTLVAAGIAMGF